MATVIRAHDPDQVPGDLPFEVEEVQRLERQEVTDPIDPPVVFITAPPDFDDALEKLRTRQRGEPVVLRVTDPELLRDERLASLVQEADQDLRSIDLVDEAPAGAA
jgi:hypothetical protein